MFNKISKILLIYGLLNFNILIQTMENDPWQILGVDKAQNLTQSQQIFLLHQRLYQDHESENPLGREKIRQAFKKAFAENTAENTNDISINNREEDQESPPNNLIIDNSERPVQQPGSAVAINNIETRTGIAKQVPQKIDSDNFSSDNNNSDNQDNPNITRSAFLAKFAMLQTLITGYELHKILKIDSNNNDIKRSSLENIAYNALSLLQITRSVNAIRTKKSLNLPLTASLTSTVISLLLYHKQAALAGNLQAIAKNKQERNKKTTKTKLKQTTWLLTNKLLPFLGYACYRNQNDNEKAFYIFQSLKGIGDISESIRKYFLFKAKLENYIKPAQL